MSDFPFEISDLPLSNDERGSFIKLFNQTHNSLQNFNIKQINLVKSKINTLRGLHYQLAPYDESKIFRVLRGSIQLACHCINTGSSNYMKTFTFILDDPQKAILVPKGYATGYLCISENVEVLYLSDNEYNPKAEKGIQWNNPRLNISWKIKKPIISEKDKNWPDYIND